MNDIIKKFKRKIKTERQLNILKAQLGSKLQNGQNQLVIADNGYQQYKDVANLSWAERIKRNLTIAKHQLNNGSVGKAAYALVGGYTPNNPRQNTGEPIILPTRTPYNVKQLLDSKGQIDVGKAAQLIKKGKDKAVQFFNSNIRKQVNAHNAEVAKRVGFKNFKVHENAGNRAAQSSKLKLKVDPKTSEGGSISTDNHTPTNDQMELNLMYNPEFASFHEHLHKGYLGNSPKEFYWDYGRDVFGDTNKYYNWLGQKVLKPYSERIGLDGADYLEKPGELPVNLLEAGKEMGLKIGQPYPGKQAVLDLLEKFRKSDSYKAGIVQHLNLNKPLRIWKGLTGTLFTGSAIGMNYGMEQSNENQ